MRDCRKNAVEKEEFGAKKNLPGRETETFVKLGKTTKANFRVVVIGIFGYPLPGFSWNVKQVGW